MIENALDRSRWVRTLRPRSVVWEVTLACNMRCLHCGSSASPLRKRPDELDTKEAIGLICDFKELGVERICFSGGEPFLRKDWERLALTVAGLGMRPGFISNGFLVEKTIAAKLKRFINARVCISLSIDGDEASHDYIRQTKGSFRRVTNAIRLLCEHGVPVSVITSVNKINLKALNRLAEHIFQYGIYAWQLQLAVPWGRMGKSRSYLLSSADYLELVEFFLKQRKIHKERVFVPDNIGYFTEAEKEFRPNPEAPWNGCQAGLTSLGITSNGGVTGCLSLQEERFLEGNIRKRKLKDIWFDPHLFAYNRKFKEEDLNGYCKKCQHRSQCRGGCRSTAAAFSGSLFEDYYCVYRISQNEAVPLEKIKLRRSSGAGKYHP